MELVSDGTNYGEGDECAKRIMNLTAYLVRSDLDFPIRHIDDCISQRCKLCVGEMQLADMQNLYGDNILYVPNEVGHSGSLGDLKEGLCEAAVIPDDWYASNQ